MSDTHGKSNHRVLVVGGGIAGMVCALELNRLGMAVTLIEKEAGVGGLSSGFCCKASETCNKCFACVVDKKIKEFSEQSQIPRLTDTEITSVTKESGSYKVSLTTAGKVSEHEATAIVVAAGVDPYEASDKGEFGYGAIKNVVTARDLEEMIRFQGKPSRPSDGRLPNNIAFIQCVGSRDHSIGNLYCSQVCCGYALRLIRTIRHTHPEVSATFYYMDIQPAGAFFKGFLDDCRKDQGIRFVRSLPSRIYHSPVTEDLKVRVADPDRGAIIEEPFDMAVLSVGMVLKKEAKTVANLLGLGFDEEGFLAVPPKEKGLFVTGACGGPKDIDRSITHAKSTAASVYHYLQGRS
jgi:heterodisulfide reductase subunit A